MKDVICLLSIIFISNPEEGLHWKNKFTGNYSYNTSVINDLIFKSEYVK